MDSDQLLLSTLLAAAVSAIAALITTIANFLSAQAANDTNKGQFFLTFTERYNSKEMNDAIFRLVEQYKDTGAGPQFIADWIQKYRSGDASAVALEYDRRVVNRYFVNIAQLYEAKLISHRLAHLLSNFYGLNVFYKIVVPMNMELYGAMKPTYESTLRRVRAGYGDGAL